MSLLALILAGVCILVVSEPHYRQAVFAQGATGTIAYVVPNDTTGDEVWLIEPNGSNNRKIYSIGRPDTFHVQAISSLVWRPDAGELVFASDHEEACSWYEVRPLCHPPSTYIIQTANYDHFFGLQYLPDGSGIILSKTDNFGDSSNIYRYDLATDSATRLTNFTNEYARDFSISPDGQTIVFERAPQQSMYLYGGPSDLWKMSINGSNMQLLVAHGAHPSWSQSAIKVPQKAFVPLVRR